MIDLNEMASQMYEVALKREEHNPIANSLVGTEMLKHLSGEVVEASMAYGIGAEPYRMELADILCGVMLLAHKEDFDIEKMLQDVFEKNRKRAEKQGDKL